MSKSYFEPVEPTEKNINDLKTFLKGLESLTMAKDIDLLLALALAPPETMRQIVCMAAMYCDTTIQMLEAAAVKQENIYNG